MPDDVSPDALERHSLKCPKFYEYNPFTRRLTNLKVFGRCAGGELS
jgi:hypothetical protein